MGNEYSFKLKSHVDYTEHVQGVSGGRSEATGRWGEHLREVVTKELLGHVGASDGFVATRINDGNEVVSVNLEGDAGGAFNRVKRGNWVGNREASKDDAELCLPAI